MRTVVALYDHLDDAQRAVQALHEAGFRSDDINFIARDTNDEYGTYLNQSRGQTMHDVGDTPAEGAAAGAGIGAVLGGLGGLLLGLGAFAIPGIGPVIGAGAIASALAGAGVGAVAGGLIGGLVDMGIPKEHAEIYAEGIRRGGTLVALRTDDERAEQARMVLNRFNPVDVDTRVQDWRRDNWKGFDEHATPMGSGQMDYNRSTNVPVTGSDVDRDMDQDVSTHRDWSSSPSGMGDTSMGTDRPDQDLNPNRDWNTTGSSSTRDQDQDLDHPVDRGSMGQDQGWRSSTGQDVRDPGMVNDPYSQNTGMGGMGSTNRSNIPVTGGMDMDDDEDTDVGDTFGNTMDTGMNEHLNEDVYSSERAHDDVVNMPVTGGMIEEEEEIDIITPQDWGTYDTQFNQDYQTRYGRFGRGYDYYQPAYRFGYDLANNPNYRGYDWNQMEPIAQQEYQRRGLAGAWDDVKDAVRHAWDKVTGH